MGKAATFTAKPQDLRALRRLGAAGLAIVALAVFVQGARADDGKIITSHGISTFGDLKYGPDFVPDYVNVNAPKGGEMSQWAFGSFDSMNPYSVKGSAAAGSSFPYESILTGTADEIGASYCLMCTTMDYAEDRSWVIFHLRQDVKFSDGSPMTAEDVVFSYDIFTTKGLSDFRTVFNKQVEKVEAELKVVKDQNAMLVDKVDKVEAHLHLTDLHLKADKGELARLNAVVDDMTAAINDMTEANGDRDDKVRRIEKVTGIIQGVLTQRAVEYKTNDREDKGGVQPRVQE